MRGSQKSCELADCRRDRRGRARRPRRPLKTSERRDEEPQQTWTQPPGNLTHWQPWCEQAQLPSTGAVAGLGGALEVRCGASGSTPRQPTGRPLKIGRAHVWNSSHTVISYAVFCLKKKKKAQPDTH